jgi:stage V sporulation protein B
MAAGVLCSEFAGFWFLWRRFGSRTRERSLLRRPSAAVSKAIYRFGLPLTLTRLLLSASGAAEAMALPARLLAFGLTASQAAAFYGQLSGVAFPLLNIPAIFTGSVATAMIPAIAEAQARKDDNLAARQVIQALGLTLLIGIPIAVFLYFFGPVLASLLFHVPAAGPLIRWLAPAGLFLWLSQISSGILQGLGLVLRGSVNTFLSCGLRLVCLWYFPAGFRDYAAGVCAAFFLSFLVNALLNLSLIRRRLHPSEGWRQALRASRPGDFPARFRAGLSAGLRARFHTGPGLRRGLRADPRTGFRTRPRLIPRAGSCLSRNIFRSLLTKRNPSDPQK